MNATLITAGIACIIAAIVGGGLKAFAIEIRVLDSGRRQAALGGFGVLLLGAGLPLNSFLPTASILSSGQRSPSTDECRLAWFGNSPPDRVTVMESGTTDAEVLAADKPKDRPVVVVVTEDGKPVGAVAFRVYEAGALFKITQVVTAGCEPLDSFRNESRGGDRHVLQNYDTVELTFGTLKYTLRLGYDSGSTKGQLTRIRTAGPTQNSVPRTATTPSPGQPPSTDECRPWFGNPPPDRVAVIESGTADAEVLAADKPKDRPIVVVVTEDGRPVGAVAFRLYEANALFKITQVVNARCEPLDSFRNESRGGDRHVLQNDDTVELTLGTLKYTLRLGYHSGSIEGQLHRV